MWVRCPFCGQIQKTNARKRKVCVYCGRSFSVFTRNGNRIVRTVFALKKRKML